MAESTINPTEMRVEDITSQYEVLIPNIGFKAFRYGYVIDVVANSQNHVVAANSTELIAYHPSGMAPYGGGITEASGSAAFTQKGVYVNNTGIYFQNRTASGSGYCQGRATYLY